MPDGVPVDVSAIQGRARARRGMHGREHEVPLPERPVPLPHGLRLAVPRRPALRRRHSVHLGLRQRHDGVPTSRPHLGEACTASAGLDCNYGQEPCESTSFVCESGTWHAKRNTCPVSTARLKKEIHYLSDAELQQLSEDTQSLRLTTYRYKDGDPAQHLGFIIEDAPSSAAVIKGRDRIDLYGYTSMTVATLQVQQKELAALRAEVETLRHEIATHRATCAK